VWCEIELRHEYDDQASGKRSPFWIDDLKPIQVASFDIAEYTGARRQFSTDEWIDLLIRTIGLEPAGMEKRLKLLYLMRLVPLCEQNYNPVELGQRETGKSFGYQQLSPYAILCEPLLQHCHR
jgi:ATP-dependent Lon protease